MKAVMNFFLEGGQHPPDPSFLQWHRAQKMTKLNFFLLLIQYKHVADVIVEFFSCATFTNAV